MSCFLKYKFTSCILEILPNNVPVHLFSHVSGTLCYMLSKIQCYLFYFGNFVQQQPTCLPIYLVGNVSGKFCYIILKIQYLGKCGQSEQLGKIGQSHSFVKCCRLAAICQTTRPSCDICFEINFAPINFNIFQIICKQCFRVRLMLFSLFTFAIMYFFQYLLIYLLTCCVRHPPQIRF